MQPLVSAHAPPVYGLKLFEGMKNAVLNRDFVNFTLNHPVAVNFYNWLTDTMIADEVYH